MLAQMAGVGVLGIPSATANSGWIGLFLLVLTAFVCMITANLLGSIMMRMPQASIRDYSSIGGAAFGRMGVFLTRASQYSTLAGVTVIFLLLSGIFFNSLVCQIPPRLATAIVGVLLTCFLIIIPSIREARFTAYVGVLSTIVATAIAIAMSVVYFSSPQNPCHQATVIEACPTCHTDLVLLTIGSGFSVYSFAFGGHSSLPNFFLEMKHPRHFYKTTALVYPSALFLLYLPMAAVAYAAYGRGLDVASSGTVLDAISYYDPNARIPVMIATAVLIIHLIAALPIVATPVCLRLERGLIKDKHARRTRSAPMIIVRITTVAVLTLLAMVLPYFMQMISIVTDISVVFSVYVFPAVFYWKLRTSSRRDGAVRTFFIRLGLVFIILYGLAGSAFGLMQAIPTLIGAVRTGGNPFSNMFVFSCPAPASSGGGGPNMTLSGDALCVLQTNVSHVLFGI